MDGAAITALAGLVTSCPLESWDQSNTVTWKRSEAPPWFSKVNAPALSPAGATMLVGNNDTLPADAGAAHSKNDETTNKRFNIIPPKRSPPLIQPKLLKLSTHHQKKTPGDFRGLKENV
ncbi:hypothetical protein [Stenotrophomonas sp. VV52]|uniref:hypothetical protein n=1 Tax=Stenotrophomonas sp. VV52 TaxID=2066958 RepID=UPI00209BEAE3|nr:hypothetical protein [Stenotrophomonas sp. VV52]